MGRNVKTVIPSLKTASCAKFGRSMFAEIRRVDLASSRPVPLLNRTGAFIYCLLMHGSVSCAKFVDYWVAL